MKEEVTEAVRDALLDTTKRVQIRDFDVSPLLPELCELIEKCSGDGEPAFNLLIEIPIYVIRNEAFRTLKRHSLLMLAADLTREIVDLMEQAASSVAWSRYIQANLDDPWHHERLHELSVAELQRELREGLAAQVEANMDALPTGSSAARALQGECHYEVGEGAVSPSLSLTCVLCDLRENLLVERDYLRIQCPISPSELVPIGPLLEAISDFLPDRIVVGSRTMTDDEFLGVLEDIAENDAWALWQTVSNDPDLGFLRRTVEEAVLPPRPPLRRMARRRRGLTDRCLDRGVRL